MHDSGEVTDLGMAVSSLTPDLARRLNIPETQGVVVIAVNRDTPASKAGVQEGDLILEVNHKLVKSVQDYRKYIEEVRKGEIVSLLMKRRAGLVALRVRK
jgi:serine protease Do